MRKLSYIYILRSFEWNLGFTPFSELNVTNASDAEGRQKS